MTVANKFINQFISIVDTKDMLEDVSMKNYTTFRIGGKADIMILPGTVEQVSKLVTLCVHNDIPWIVIGNGSNLLISDKGIRGVVIKLGDNFNDIKLDGNNIVAQSGALLSKTAYLAMSNELTGLEFASGIPGSIGGGILMNAGAYDGELSFVTVKSTFLDSKGDISELNGEEHQFSYRHSVYQDNGGIILSGVFALKNGNLSLIKQKTADFTNRRKTKQPLELPSAGSAFKRPVDHFASKLIEDCGLKGYIVGGAQVSVKHCGFIVNIGNATCADVLRVIDHVKETVLKMTGVELQPEIKITGDFS